LVSSSIQRVDSAALADALQISLDHARLVLDTLASVLHSESDPLVTSRFDDVDSVGADLLDLILFLYIQSYKRLLPRSHKDAAAVADVWPSTSAFDGYLSALSPLQLVRCNTRRFMPSQADEVAHQLSYLQKHLANILSLLSEPVEGEGEEPLVISMEGFEHLGFLIQFEDKGSDGDFLSQAAPIFANSDPDMPAVPVPASQVLGWLLQNIASSLEHVTEKNPAKENGPPSGSDQDVVKASPSVRSPCFIEGVSKSSYVKQASDLKNSSLKVINCHDSVIYILAPLRYATIYGCSDATIVLGAVGKAVQVEHCERVHVIIAAKRVCIANCRECVFFLGVNHRPLIVGDNHKLQNWLSHSLCHSWGPMVLSTSAKSAKLSTLTGGWCCLALKCTPPFLFSFNFSMVCHIYDEKRREEKRKGFDVVGWLARLLLRVRGERCLKVAPYNTYYSRLEEHMTEVGIEAIINRWDDTLELGMIDPHNSLSHPAGVSDAQAESATRLDPDHFTKFLIPNWLEGESTGSTKDNPFPLTDPYLTSQQKNVNALSPTDEEEF
ncbi:hypothetical protein Godav_015739, partial [Gossypium davidsonii]|nr:hypothetical protein [Gossypium davidsonii]